MVIDEAKAIRIVVSKNVRVFSSFPAKLRMVICFMN